MRCASINSKDFLGPENPGRRLSAGFSIMLATFLSEDMDVNARMESLRHYLGEDRRDKRRRDLYQFVFEQTTVAASVKLLCKHFGLASTPRIEKNLREVVIAMSKVRKEEIRRQINELEQRRSRILKLERF